MKLYSFSMWHLNYSPRVWIVQDHAATVISTYASISNICLLRGHEY